MGTEMVLAKRPECFALETVKDVEDKIETISKVVMGLIWC
jgi:hypothetical protein